MVPSSRSIDGYEPAVQVFATVSGSNGVSPTVDGSTVTRAYVVVAFPSQPRLNTKVRETHEQFCKSGLSVAMHLLDMTSDATLTLVRWESGRRSSKT